MRTISNECGWKRCFYYESTNIADINRQIRTIIEAIDMKGYDRPHSNVDIDANNFIPALNKRYKK